MSFRIYLQIFMISQVTLYRIGALMKILVVDAQGGGIGKQLVTAIKKNFPDAASIWRKPFKIRT